MNVNSNNPIKCNLALADLQFVMDPEIGLNVVDLGLIYSIDFDEENKKIHCKMTLTTEYCPMGESIVDGVKTTLEDVFQGYEVEVELTFEPAWSYEMISEEGRTYLGR